MLQAILDFPTQFAYRPQIVNQAKLKKSRKYIVLGMGGSHLAAGLIKTYEPGIHLHIRRQYGLPPMSRVELRQHLIIASSYSGNTEEVVDGLKTAIRQKLNVMVIATGGRLISLAKKHKLPYIQIPDTGIQPRSALGFSIKALLKAMGKNKELQDISSLAKILKSKPLQKHGEKIAKMIKNHVPVIYASTDNMSLAYNWKIKFNETGKSPAVYNVLPELNHNEMNSFDVSDSTRVITRPFYFIFLRDNNDHPRIIKRMSIVAKLYKQKKLSVMNLDINPRNIWLGIFSNLLLADWVAYYTALGYKRDPEKVNLIETFKKMMK